MNRIDVVLAIVLALFTLRGFWRGFSREFFGFVGLIGGLAVAAASYAAAAPHVPAAIPEYARPIVAFAAVFLAVDLAANVLGGVLHNLFGVLFLSSVNRAAGALFGAAKGAALSTIALLLVRAYVPSPALKLELEHSRLARPLVEIAGGVRAEMATPGDGDGMTSGKGD